MDDYMLITSFLHCYDFNKIIQDVNFSKKFSLSEVQERWTQLLYNESLAKLDFFIYFIYYKSIFFFLQN